MNNNLVTYDLGKIRLYNGDCMEWISTKHEMPNTSEDVFVLLNGEEAIVAYYGKGRSDYDHMKSVAMWRSTLGNYVYPDVFVTHFMYIPKLNK